MDKDVIYRQDAIDAMWKIRRQLQMLDDTHKADRVMHGIYLAKKALEQLPSAQPEIIRCKDCKWYEGDIMANPWGVCCHDGWVGGHIGHEVSERGWCYRAERRTYG